MPYIPFTDEQKRQANLMDLSEFLRRKGEPLIQSGRELRMGSNHSVTVRGNEWYDHAAETGGGPVSFLKEFYGMDYPEAVLALLGQDGGPLRQIRAPNEKMKKSVVHSAPSTSSAVALIFSTVTEVICMTTGKFIPANAIMPAGTEMPAPVMPTVKWL